MEITHRVQSIIFMLFFSYSPITSAEHSINITQFESCSCDMTGGSCDIRCCCDKECDEFQKKSFLCDAIPVQHNPLHDSCSDIQNSPEQGFHTLLCLHKENSPYLGHHFHDYSIINDLPALNNILSKRINPQIEEQSGSRRRSGNLNRDIEGGYYYKQELVVISKNLWTSSLRFPYSLFGGVCDSFHPVRYLEDVSSACFMEVRNGALSSKDLDLLFVGPDGQKLLGDPHDDLPLQNISITYFYVPQPCCYTDSINCSEVSEGNRSIVSINPTEHDLAKSLILNAEYKFSWRGGRIYSANIKLVFGNASVINGLVKQKFSAVFKHVKNNPAKNHSDKTENPLFGYRIGDFILSYNGNDTVNANSDIDQNVTDSWSLLSVLDSDGDGTCDEGSIPVKFGHTTMSGCFYSIRNWTAMDCWEMRKTAQEFHSSTLSGVFGISATGRGEKMADKIIIVEDIDEPSPNNATVDSEKEPISLCQEMPHQVTLELFFTESGTRMHDSAVTYVIVKAIRKYKWTSWGILAKDNNWRSDAMATTRHPMYSSVHFRHISILDIEKRARTKRSKLLEPESRHCDGETCWSDVLYFLRAYSDDVDQFLIPDGYLSRMSYVFYLVTVLTSLLVIVLGSIRRNDRRF